MSKTNNLGLPDKVSRVLSRNDDGLLENVDYIFDEDGMVDWRKMVKTEHLVNNRQKTKETDVTKLKDNELLILLAGIKELAQFRGYTDVSYDVTAPSSDYVVATCSITWVPNFETEGREVTFSAIGDASPNNTNSFARYFLGPIAENRAFVRCVRNFLKINIVGNDEVPAGNFVQPEENLTSEENLSNPTTILENLMSSKGVSFDKIKEKLLEEGEDKAKDYTSVSDIPRLKTFELIERIKKAKVKA